MRRPRAASASNRYLVRLEPGNFTCGSSQLEVPAWVTIEGSGPELTSISGAVELDFFGVVHLTDGSTLRSLTVDNTLSNAAKGGMAVSIFKLDGVALFVFLDRVFLSAALAGPNNREIYAFNANFSATNSTLGRSDLTDVTADYQYSRVGSAVGSGFTQTCRFCYEALGDPVDASCN